MKQERIATWTSFLNIIEIFTCKWGHPWVRLPSLGYNIYMIYVLFRNTFVCMYNVCLLNLFRFNFSTWRPKNYLLYPAMPYSPPGRPWYSRQILILVCWPWHPPGQPQPTDATPPSNSARSANTYSTAQVDWNISTGHGGKISSGND